MELSEVGWKDQSSCCVGGARLGRGCVMVTVQWGVEGWAGPADVLEWKSGGSGRTPSLLCPVPLDTGMGSGAAGDVEGPCPGFAERGLARDTGGPLRHTGGADSRRGAVGEEQRSRSPSQPPAGDCTLRSGQRPPPRVRGNRAATQGWPGVRGSQRARGPRSLVQTVEAIGNPDRGEGRVAGLGRVRRLWEGRRSSAR